MLNPHLHPVSLQKIHPIANSHKKMQPYEPQEQFRRLIKSIPASMAMVDQQMCYISASPRWQTEYGFTTAEDIIGKSHYILFPHCQENWQQIQENCLKDGETETKNFQVQPWFNNHGDMGGLILISKSYHSASEQLQAVLDAVPGLVSWVSSDLRYIGVNRHLANAFDLPAESFMGKEVGFLESSPKLAGWIKQFFESSDKTIAYETSVELEEGERNYLIVGQKYHRDTRAVFVGVDITQRKQAEKQLVIAKDQLQAVLDAVPGLISWVGSDLKYLGVNRHLADHFNLPQNTFAGREVGFIESKPGFADLAKQFFASSHDRGSVEVNLGVEDKRHSYLIVSQKYDQGSKAVFVGLDITERKQIEAEMRRSKNLYRTLAHNFPNGAVCLFDTDLKYTLAEGTELAKHKLSKKLMVGKTLWEVFPEQHCQIIEPLYRAALAGETNVVEVPQGNEIYLMHTLPVKNELGKVLAGMVMTQNITKAKEAEQARVKSEEKLKQQAQELEQTLIELKLTQTQLIQTEKMSSLGQLVAGVAHEINNPVSFIYGNLTYARQYTQELLNILDLYRQHYPKPHSEIAEMIEDMGLEFIRQDFLKLLNSMQVGADRIREVVLSLRNFSRIDENQKKPVDIHTGIDSTLLILQNRLKAKAGRSGIEVIKDYGDLPPIACYAGQLNQVFMNLLSNAIDAIEESVSSSENDSVSVDYQPKSQGIIEIQTGLDEQNVFIKIQDNGKGMDEEVIQRIYEPFFTTKAIGKGTGLGLSISYQIIEKHQGTLICDSTVGKGTSFMIIIPCG